MLWVDKYRPRDLSKMDYHQELSARLSDLAKDGDIPHLLFYGPSGAGKKTRIAALLKALFGNSAEKRKLEHREFKTPTNRIVETVTSASSYHIEINPSDAGSADCFVVQEIIKEIAQSSSLVKKNTDNTCIAYKVVVLVEVDRLSRQAQAALRRTMEKCTTTCRLILCCENPSKVIDPVRSRCLGIRVAAPKESEIVTILNHVASLEHLFLPPKLAARIAKLSQRNIRRALLSLETCAATNSTLTDDLTIHPPDWFSFIQSIASDILSDQSPQRLLSTRDKLYDLLSKCIPPDLIIKSLVSTILPKLDDDLKANMLKSAALYEHRIQLGSKPIFHLEAFIANFMAHYKA